MVEKKDVAMAAISAVIGGLVVFLGSNSMNLYEKSISSVQLEELGRKFINNEDHVASLLKKMEESGNFRGSVGEKGDRGESPAPDDVAEVLMNDNEFIDQLKTTKILYASAQPQYTEVLIENENNKLINDFPNMIRYRLEFKVPVDVVIPRMLAYTDNWSLWKIDKDPVDNRGKKWIVSFQVKPAIASTKNVSTGFGSFIGIAF